MVTKLHIYFEGDWLLKPGFHAFFKEIREIMQRNRCGFKLVAAGGTPIQDFNDALKSDPDAWNVLLLDSEEPLKGCSRSKQLDSKYEASVFWMVEAMESWFLADLTTLCACCGNHVTESALVGNQKVEEISKTDVMARVKKACGGTYLKTKHAPKLLAAIDPALVRKAAPNCGRMFQTILQKLSNS